MIDSISACAAIRKSVFFEKSAGGHSGHGRTVNGVLTAVAGSPEAGAPTSIHSPERSRPAWIGTKWAVNGAIGVSA